MFKSCLLINIVVQVLDSTIWQKKEIKGKMEKVKLSLFTHDMTAYIENLKESKNY